MNEIKINNDNIDSLLERFFDGDTSCAEEKALEEYFRSNEVPERHKCYRDMFGWYASGMKEEELPKPRRRFPWRHVLGWTSAAAVAALLVTIALPHLTDSTSGCMENCYVVHNGKMITGEEIRPEIEASVIEADYLDREIEMRISAIAGSIE